MLYDLPEEEADTSLAREDAVGSRGWRDLKIYRAAHELGVETHHFSLRLPKYELYETGSQLRRAVKSVSANLVEGDGRRRYKAAFLRFLVYAKASLDETQEHLHYVCDCHSDLAEGASILLRSASDLGRRLSRFLNAVEANHHP